MFGYIHVNVSRTFNLSVEIMFRVKSTNVIFIKVNLASMLLPGA